MQLAINEIEGASETPHWAHLSPGGPLSHCLLQPSASTPHPSLHSFPSGQDPVNPGLQQVEVVDEHGLEVSQHEDVTAVDPLEGDEHEVLLPAVGVGEVRSAKCQIWPKENLLSVRHS